MTRRAAAGLCAFLLAADAAAVITPPSRPPIAAQQESESVPTCQDTFPANGERPKVTETFPARGFTGYTLVLDLTIEHEERVDVPLVVVRPRALVTRVRDRELEHVELRLHRLDQDRPLLLTERLALAGPADDRLHDPEIMT